MPTWNRLHCVPSRLRARLRQQHGQALVEFAVVLPVLLAIVLGILYFGRYESYSSQMTQLSEEGARDAAVNYSVPSGAYANSTTACTQTPSSGTNSGNLACFIASQASGELASGNGSTVQAVSVWVNCAGGNACAAGSNGTVCLRAQVQFPGLNVAAGTVFQSATMRVEQAGTYDSSYAESSSNTPTPTSYPTALPANSPC